MLQTCSSFPPRPSPIQSMSALTGSTSRALQPTFKSTLYVLPVSELASPNALIAPRIHMRPMHHLPSVLLVHSGCLGPLFHHPSSTAAAHRVRGLVQDPAKKVPFASLVPLVPFVRVASTPLLPHPGFSSRQQRPLPLWPAFERAVQGTTRAHLATRTRSFALGASKGSIHERQRRASRVLQALMAALQHSSWA